MTTWNIEKLTGYKPKTDAWEYLTAHREDISEEICELWLSRYGRRKNIVFYTEFVMALNWKIWELADLDEQTARKFDSLWKKYDSQAFDLFKGEDIAYYLQTTD